MLGFPHMARRAEILLVLLAVLAAGGCASDSTRLAAAPTADTTGTIAFSSAGGLRRGDRVSAPVRIHSGAADDWTPARHCAELAASLKGSGQDVVITLYPAAHHGFDQAPPREIFLPNVNNGSACFPQAPSILGPFAAASVAGCLKKGATLGGNPDAAAAARRSLRAQLDELMR